MIQDTLPDKRPAGCLCFCMNAEQRKRHRAEGRCIQCSDFAIPGQSLCAKHREKHKQDNRRRDKTEKGRASLRKRWARHWEKLGATGQQELRTRQRFKRATSRAKHRQLTWAITKEEFYSLVSKPCAYCAFPIEGSGAGLDRIDNAQGYILTNVVPCCTDCNLARNDNFTYSEMLLIGEVIKTIKLNRKQS